MTIPFASRPILVTGGCGFIGSCFIRQLLGGPEPWCPVVNLDKLTYAGNLKSLGEVRDIPDHTFIHGDIANPVLVQKVLVEKRPRAIVNFAAETHVDRSIATPDDFMRTNVLGTFNLLDKAFEYWCQLGPEERAAFRFVQISTDEVYGSIEKGEFHEDDAFCPNSPYAAAKAAGDHFCRAYFKTYGFPTIVTHGSNTYGPYQHPEKLIPRMILRALAGESLPVYGDGKNVRDWLYVGDHCKAIRAVLNEGTPGESYNIGGGNERANLGVVEDIREIVSDRAGLQPAPIEYVGDRKGHDFRYAVSYSKLIHKTGWLPILPFDCGLVATVQWYIDNPEWVESMGGVK